MNVDDRIGRFMAGAPLLAEQIGIAKAKGELAALLGSGDPWPIS